MIILSSLVDCMGCGQSFDGEWEIDVDTVQDMDEAPEQEQVCPGCGRSQAVVWTGWVNRTEAG